MKYPFAGNCTPQKKSTKQHVSSPKAHQTKKKVSANTIVSSDARTVIDVFVTDVKSPPKKCPLMVQTGGGLYPWSVDMPSQNFLFAVVRNQ